MTSKIISLPSAEELLKTLAVKLQPLLKANTALVGIQSGGVWLMQRLLVLLEKDLSASAIEPVSYTHLDVYKRQAQHHCGAVKRVIDGIVVDSHHRF